MSAEKQVRVYLKCCHRLTAPQSLCDCTSVTAAVTDTPAA